MQFIQSICMNDVSKLKNEVLKGGVVTKKERDKKDCVYDIKESVYLWKRVKMIDGSIKINKTYPTCIIKGQYVILFNKSNHYYNSGIMHTCIVSQIKRIRICLLILYYILNFAYFTNIILQCILLFESRMRFNTRIAISTSQNDGF